MTVETIDLATGAKLPLLGLGTWQAKDANELSTALRKALDIGYRLIDTAFFYTNEHIIGEVLHEYISSGKIKREELFITSKLPPPAHAPEEVEKTVDFQLKQLQLDYIDLYLIHTPCAMKWTKQLPPGQIDFTAIAPAEVPHLDTWRELEKLFKAGKLKAIGLSNFNSKQIQNIIDHGTVVPHNLQVECHIYLPQFELHDYCKKHNITFTAYAPIGSPGRKAARPDAEWPDGEPLKDPLVLELSKKYSKTPAQILLRHLTQRKISVIPKSVRAERVVENFNIFDFKLSDDDVKQLDSVTTRVRLFTMDFMRGHKDYPLNEPF